MKKLLLFILALMTYNVSAQEIIKNEKDEFTGAKVIETSWERIFWKNSIPAVIYAKVRLVNDATLLDLKIMTGEACVIGTSDKLMMKDTNGDIHSLLPTKTFSGEIGGGSIGLMGSSGWGIGVTYKGDLSFLKELHVTKLRIYTTDSYYEVELKKKGQELLSGLYNVAHGANSKSALDKYK